MNFSITGDHIDLNKLLKAAGIVESGGIAGELIKSGEVTVDGEVETRKRKKIFPGSQVALLGETIDVTQ